MLVAKLRNNTRYALWLTFCLHLENGVWRLDLLGRMDCLPEAWLRVKSRLEKVGIQFQSGLLHFCSEYLSTNKLDRTERQKTGIHNTSRLLPRPGPDPTRRPQQRRRRRPVYAAKRSSCLWTSRIGAMSSMLQRLQLYGRRPRRRRPSLRGRRGRR